MSAASEFSLLSPSQAEPRIARLLASKGECDLAVSEERAFRGKWLSLGKISLVASRVEDADPVKLLQNGAFEWQLPDLATSKAETSCLLELEPGHKHEDRVQGVMDWVACMAARVGCIHPRFDPAALEQMPFRRSTTVVVDTSAVLQGALDFVVRFLHPAARVKIPTITQMEIANQADRFLSIRRRGERNKPPLRTRELLEHIRSQGGQRALLRVELHADTEVERTYLLGDPLRSAFVKDTDSELKELELSTPFRSYADRLILESARHHQAQSGPAHVVRLLTGDQGLARMAITEGVRPLYFTATSAADVFGQRLPGQTFHPFSGHIRHIPLTALVWELATCFGSARLVYDQATFQVTAIGEQLPWTPYHAEQDLLWCSQQLPSPTPARPNPTSVPMDARPAGNQIRAESPQATSSTRSTRRPASFLRFNVERLFRLVCRLDDLVEISAPEVEQFLGPSFSEYRRFLQSGDFIELTAGRWIAGKRVPFLAAALRNERIGEVKEALLEVPSFAALIDLLQQLAPGEPLEGRQLKRGLATYRVLGEVTLLCATVARSEIYATPNVPDVNDFALIALDRFSSLDREDSGLVATGEWLEALIQHDGIHPETARRLLDVASETGLLRRSTEGSTTQLRFRERIVHVLRTESGLPSVAQASLYQGDYLLPGKASASLRIEGPIL